MDYKAKLQQLQKNNLYRQLYYYENYGIKIKYQKKIYINFCANDYLGLAKNKTVINSALKYLKKHGCSATASPLICGCNTLYRQTAARLADFKKTETALIFSSGYLANIGILNTFITPRTGVFMDRLCHASIIDGVLLSKSRWFRYQHNNLNDLEKKLSQNKKNTNKIIITESVFSMDGDLAPLKELKYLADKYKAFLYVDEAHATGVYGSCQEGRATESNLNNQDNVLLMGTMSKALGNCGAYWAGPAWQKQYLINKARTFIYNTGLPPAVLGGVYGALQYLAKHPRRGRKVLAKADAFREKAHRAGLPLLSSTSQIVPLKTGSSEKALHLADYLKAHNILAVAIRPPTVPDGKARIRFTFSADHTRKDIAKLLYVLTEYKERFGF
ncbi:MAG TPA: 8-amino-7-oxononanoate synthase [Spirochaetota bacterium]|nr:8-amino-7-oxononanoate synthase [Spirochaetota bacterium]